MAFLFQFWLDKIYNLDNLNIIRYFLFDLVWIFLSVSLIIVPLVSLFENTLVDLNISTKFKAIFES